MYKLSTAPWRLATVLLAIAAPWLAHAQSSAPVAAGLTPDWRHIGNLVLDEGLAGAASGPCKRVWFGPGGMLYVQTGSGRVYQTADLENWQTSSALAPAVAINTPVGILPEPGAQTRALAGDGSRVYAFGEYVYRSEDGGTHWENSTIYRGTSLIGAGITDLAIAPGNSDEIVTAGAAGVFRSVDGGRSWSGLNEDLPNLPATRLLDLPAGAQGARIALNNDTAAAWPPGNKQAWIPVSNADLVQETQLRRALSSIRGANVTAVTIAGDFIYSGMQNGSILVSADRGVSWQTFSPSAGPAGSGPVERFWVDSQDPRVALAALGAAPADPLRASAPVHVLHTINGGAFWDNFTANLADAAVHGVAADPASGALYAATDRGVFLAYADLSALGVVQNWTALAGLPDGAAAAAAMDVKLDAQGNLLWTAIDGYGVYAALAPHRLRDPNVVSAADMIQRAVAPGSLVSILGAQVESVQAGGIAAPVLAATGGESQIQIPFEARGAALPLAASVAGVSVNLPSLPLAAAAPVIFVARDGSPMLLDSDKGVMLDAMTAAHSGTRIQILATGLGRVTPAWPTGVAAPLENPPLVAGNVHVYLDREPVEVTRAELAPGYVGFYLVEIAVPKISNYGPAELYLDVDGAASNRVRVYIEP